jgi:putative ABC transport system permease protein
MDAMRNDLRLAIRGLWRTKGFSMAAVLTLAIGIGGATMIFALVRGVLLRPLPVPEQDRLIVAWQELKGGGSSHHDFGDREIEFVRDASRLIEMAAGVSAHGAGRGLYTEGRESSYAVMGLVAGPFFQVLGVDALLGRALTAADDVDGAEPVVVISHGLWTRQYARAPSVIGRKISIQEQRFTIVGVMPRDLDYPIGIEMWRPTHTVPTTGPFGDAARQEIDLVARLRPGVTLEQARSELASLLSRAEAKFSKGTAPAQEFVPIVHSLEDVIVGDVRASIAGLMAAVALVLIIACANVANLLLMRGEGKRGELALRAALGATRARIARQLLAESVVLTAIAASLGVIVSWWSLRTVLGLVPDGMPRIEAIRLDGAVMLFTTSIAFVASSAAGLTPTLALMRASPLSSLNSASRGSSGVASTLGRRALVVAQVALAVVIVAGAGLLTRSVLRLQGVDKGFTSDRLLFAELSLPEAAVANRARHAAFLERAVSELQALPGVESATPVNVKPFAGIGWDVPRFRAEGQGDERAAANPALNLESIYPNYFATLGIAIVRGRAFADTDRDGTQPVAILSDDVAAATWPGEDPIGKRIRMGGPSSKEPWVTVIGVAATTRYRELARPRPTLYLPAAQFLVTAERIILRTNATADRLAAAIRDRIGAIDASALVVRVAPFAQMLDAPLARPRFNAFLLGIFGLTALVLSTIGLYAVMAASVRQRDRELAIRLALGATAANLRRLVLREAMWLSGAGALVGLASALAGTRVLRELVYEIDVLDPSTLAFAVVLSIAGSMLASWLPMLKAARIDAMSVLRH